MIGLHEIKKAYLDLLKTEYTEEQYKYYGLEVTEGYTRPSFFVRILKDGGQQETKCTHGSKATLETTLFLEERDEVKALEMVDKIETLIGHSLKVGNKHLPVTDFSQDYAGKEGNIPVIRIKLEWLEDNQKPDDSKKIKEFKLKEELQNGNA